MDAAIDNPRKALYSLAWLIAIVAAASGAMWVLRTRIVEPETVAQACLAGARDWRCPLREWLVFGFTRNIFGMAAAIAGVLAIISRWRGAALAAILLGVAGAMLYHYALSGAGLLLGALTWVRPAQRKN